MLKFQIKLPLSHNHSHSHKLSLYIKRIQKLSYLLLTMNKIPLKFIKHYSNQKIIESIKVTWTKYI